jgi:hypothetical protein
MYQVQTLRKSQKVPRGLTVAREYTSGNEAILHAQRLARGKRPPLFTQVYDTVTGAILVSYMLNRRYFD